MSRLSADVLTPRLASMRLFSLPDDGSSGILLASNNPTNMKTQNAAAGTSRAKDCRRELPLVFLVALDAADAESLTP